MKEATRTATKPNGTTPTTSASASPVATRAVNKSAGGGGSGATTGSGAGDYTGTGGGGGSSNLSAIPNLTTNDQVGNVVGHEFNSQPSQNQNEINVTNSNLLKAQIAPHQRSQSLSGMQPVNKETLFLRHNAFCL